MKGVSGVTSWEGGNKQGIYEECNLEVCAKGVNCGVVELGKRYTERFGHIETMKNRFCVGVYEQDLGSEQKR